MLTGGRQHGLGEAPHPGRERATAHARPGVEQGAQRVAALGRRVVADLEQSPTRGTARVRVGLGMLAAAARADLPGAAPPAPPAPHHAPASFSTSFRMPPAVTSGPAPGPVITSGFFL